MRRFLQELAGCMERLRAWQRRALLIDEVWDVLGLFSCLLTASLCFKIFKAEISLWWSYVQPMQCYAMIVSLTRGQSAAASQARSFRGVCTASSNLHRWCISASGFRDSCANSRLMPQCEPDESAGEYMIQYTNTRRTWSCISDQKHHKSIS